MSFSYDFSANPLVAYVRLLIADTQAPGIFSDEEVTAAYSIQASQFQSGMYFSGAAGLNLPNQPVSYLRVAALLLDSLASNAARLASVTKLLDVTLGPDKAAASLRAQAKQYRETDDDAGAFVLIEQVNDSFSFADRYWKTWQRQAGGIG